MKNINLNFHSQARVWIEDAPSIIYPVIDTLTKDVQTGLTRNSERQRQVALEILIPVGVRILYGLLGAKFIPHDSGKLSLAVLVSTNNEFIFEQSIASQLDRVRVGLPNEYSQSIVDGALKALDRETIVKLGSGLIQFDLAAHGEIGSSNKFFRKIAAIVVQLLTIDTGSSEQEVTEIVKNYSFV